MTATAWRAGFDIGGTVTELVLLDDVSGATFRHKTFTTPADPSVGAWTGLRELLDLAGVAPGQVSTLIHGTTLAINSLLERKGARTAFVTTKGFRDVLELGREYRYDIYDLDGSPAPPLLPRSQTVVGDEPHLPYDRPPLSKQVLMGQVPTRQTTLPRHDELDAQWRLGIAATGLDLSGKQVLLADGGKVGFDRLLIATGWRRPRARCEVRRRRQVRGSGCRRHDACSRGPGRGRDRRDRRGLVQGGGCRRRPALDRRRRR